MKIWFSKYQLYPKGSLNSKSKTKFRQGALLRVRSEEGTVGYSDLCPFSEMGDRPIDLELTELSKGRLSSLAQRSLYFANLDAEARAKNESLFRSQCNIKNHFLISDITRFDLHRAAKIELAGYTEFKIKLGRDLVSETESLKNFCSALSATSKVRLDFNCITSVERFTNWFDTNQKWLRPTLEFIEDPFAYDANEWRNVSQKWGLTLALDQAADAISTGGEGAQILVIKPAVYDSSAIIEKFKGTSKKFVFTHYMDFPVGQMFALVEAQRAYQLVRDQFLTCGLQHHDIYEGFTFQDAIKYDGPYVLPPDGKGIGFDSLLNSLKWIEI